LGKNDKLRILLAKPPIDTHDRGILILARALRDAGMEVIYAGLRQSWEQIVNTALEEDVNLIGISSLAGGERILIPKFCKLLKESNAADIPVIVGGSILDRDIPFLEQAGIMKCFKSGTGTREVIDFIEKTFDKIRQS
jgi:methylmalonyl-CoA mutase C-terminal domain/subunit